MSAWTKLSFQSTHSHWLVTCWSQMVDSDSDVQIAVAELERKFVRSFAKVRLAPKFFHRFFVLEETTLCLFFFWSKYARLSLFEIRTCVECLMHGILHVQRGVEAALRGWKLRPQDYEGAVCEREYTPYHLRSVLQVCMRTRTFMYFLPASVYYMWMCQL